jgi:hypothetical protein
MAYEQIREIGWPTLAVCSVGLYLLAAAVYRLYLSPLARFPGPKLAALTLWYEFYYDVIKTGAYMGEIQKMHERYGKHYPSIVMLC